MSESQDYKDKVGRLVENLDHYDWGAREREVINELRTCKRFNQEQKGAIRTLIWRLDEMKRGGVQRIKPHWEA